jgi:transposase
MIQRLCTLRGVGVQSATVLVREGFVRTFRNSRALGSYAGLTGTPWASGGMSREQGISKAGNRHLRTVDGRSRLALAPLAAQQRSCSMDCGAYG